MTANHPLTYEQKEQLAEKMVVEVVKILKWYGVTSEMVSKKQMLMYVQLYREGFLKGLE